MRGAQVIDQGFAKEGRDHLVGFSCDLSTCALLNQSLINIRGKGHRHLAEIRFRILLILCYVFHFFHATLPQTQNFALYLRAA
jgi:hypothetical protein